MPSIPLRVAQSRCIPTHDAERSKLPGSPKVDGHVPGLRAEISSDGCQVGPEDRRGRTGGFYRGVRPLRNARRPDLVVRRLQTLYGQTEGSRLISVWLGKHKATTDDAELLNWARVWPR